jgi:hypothetical protein
MIESGDDAAFDLRQINAAGFVPAVGRLCPKAHPVRKKIKGFSDVLPSFKLS